MACLPKCVLMSEEVQKTKGNDSCSIVLTKKSDNGQAQSYQISVPLSMEQSCQPRINTCQTPNVSSNSTVPLQKTSPKSLECPPIYVQVPQGRVSCQASCPHKPQPKVCTNPPPDVCFPFVFCPPNLEPQNNTPPTTTCCPPPPDITVSWPQPTTFKQETVDTPCSTTEGTVQCEKMVPHPAKINRLLLYFLVILMPVCPIAIPCPPKLICVPCPSPCPAKKEEPKEEESWPFAVPISYPGEEQPVPKGVKVLPPPVKRICPPGCVHYEDIKPGLKCMYDQGRLPCRAHCFAHVPKRGQV